MAVQTVASNMDRALGRPSGFDYMRLLLALGVIASHAPLVAFAGPQGYLAWQYPYLPFTRIILPMFFALSGFLVAGSFERCRTMISFFGLRVMRIVPALAVETLLSAIILGPLLTNRPLADYFTDPLFLRYFLNILGEPQYLLPGLFEQNPVPEVNRQLWTVPWELGCYASLGVLAFLRVRGKPVMALAALIAISLACIAFRELVKGGMPHVNQAFPGELLVAAFLGGVVVHAYRDSLRSDRLTIAVLTVVSTSLVLLPGYWMILAPLPLAWLTVAIGTSNPPRLALIEGADYSYGMFLYGFPLQQVLMHLFPAHRDLWLSLLGATLLAYVLAAASWHWVEKPVMSRRAWLKNLEDRYVAWRGG